MKRNQLLRKIYWTSGLLGVFILAFLTSVIFLNPTSVGNETFVWNINLWAFIWALCFVIVVVLAFVLARSLIKLFFEYQENRPGSRIKSKLVLTLIIFSLFPALIMFFLAFGLINQNLAQWFSAPSEQLLRSSELIAEQYYAGRRQAGFQAAQFLGDRIAESRFSNEIRWEALARDYGFEDVLILDLRGEVLYPSASRLADRLLRSEIDQVLSGQPYYLVERRINTDYGLVGVPIRSPEGSVQGALFAQFFLPESVTFHAVRVSEANQAYQGLKGTVAPLRLNYFAILALTTLAVVFGFVWLGNYIARKITVPLEALAEGSRELAGGNLDYRVHVQAVDELGILVDAFNRMAAEIKESRQDLEKANEELKTTNVQLDQRRRYIETILQNIATGVLSLDEHEVIRTVNEAALKMLQTTRSRILDRSLESVADPELYREFQLMKKRARLYGTYRKPVTFPRGDRQLYVAATVSCNLLPLEGKIEYLVVLDDLTELIRAEKFAAWQEVARRLAHEIKNPLTPIQLSAERIQKRFDRLLQSPLALPELEDFGRVLRDSTRMIISESEMLKNLVQEFSRFARLPICRPVPVELHGLIERALGLYDGALESVRVAKGFDRRIGKIQADPEQLQRVFVNLLDNSLGALAEVEGERCITIRTDLNESRGSVTIQFEDTGTGIAPEDYDNLFLPYFSTKKKGTGLGLAIVRQIVSEHNGFIRAEPNPPRGSRFIIELPVS